LSRNKPPLVAARRPRYELLEALVTGAHLVHPCNTLTLREKLIKISARIVHHGRYVVFQLAEVAVPRALFAAILRRIDRLRGPPVPAV